MKIANYTTDYGKSEDILMDLSIIKIGHNKYNIVISNQERFLQRKLNLGHILILIYPR